MDSMVVLYWIRSPGKPWKVFLANRVKKVVEIIGKLGIAWKYCPMEKNFWEVEELESAIWRQEGGLQVPDGY